MKNQNWARGIDRQAYRDAIATGIGATIDNGATTQELRHLSTVLKLRDLSPRQRATYSDAFGRGLQFLLAMQYPSGGFPQFYPPKSPTHYSRHITLNDDATVAVLQLLHDVALRRPPYEAVPLSDSLRSASADAFQRGLRCLLDCQIQKDGRLTVWCQQHDELTLRPAQGRAYELPSFSGCGESVKVLQLLMQFDLQDPLVHPCATRICLAVHAGVRWLWSHRIEGMRLERFTNADGLPDQRFVPDSHSQTVYLARFYDLTSEQPFYCDRDGQPRSRLADIGYERRNGYAWLRPFPMQLMRQYEEWRTLNLGR